jgi:hypothetical protein
LEGFPGFRKAWAFLQKTLAVDHRKQKLISKAKKADTTKTKHVNRQAEAP